MRVILFVFSTVFCSVAMASEHLTLPYYFSVFGVSKDDVLNIRDDPNATSKIVGHFSWNEKLVTISKLSPDKKWGLIPSDGDYWVSMKYLKPLKLKMFDDTRIPVGLTCFAEGHNWRIILNEPKPIFFKNSFEEGEPADFYYETKIDGVTTKFVLNTDEDDIVVHVSERLCETTASTKFPYSVGVLDEDKIPLNKINGKILYDGECCSLSKEYLISPE